MSKTILITGSTDGIGKLAAIKLAKDGHEVLLHGRNADKLSAVVDQVRMASSNQSVSGFVADFSDLEAVRIMAEKILQGHSKLDVLINNAGVFNSPVASNNQGWDMRYAVNYFAPYVLTNALIPLLQNGDEPRIVNLSSAAQASLDYQAMAGQKQESERQAYAQSKLAITMWSFHLAATFPDIVTIPVNPGSLLNTNMVREAFGKYWSSADKGADILYDLAVGEEHAGMSGKYFDNDQGAYGPAHADAYNAAEVQKLVEMTARQLS